MDIKVEGLLEIKETDYDGCVQTSYVSLNGENLSYILDKLDGRNVIIEIKTVK